MSNKIIKASRRFGAVALVASVVLGGAAAEEKLPEEKFPILKVGGEVYTNVTVTSVTATDIYFSHAQGLGNAKLKKLDPEWQKHFKFDATKAGEAEKNQREANTRFRVDLASRKAIAPAAQTEGVSPDETSYDDGDIVVNKLYAKSFRGQRPPPIIVEEWLTPSPNVEGKFVLVDFWATWGEPCREAVPHLNNLQAKFKDRLVVIGLSNETPEEMKKMSSPKVKYYVGTDPQARTMKMVGVEGIPHSLLIDPKGIARYEGVSAYLDENALAKLIAKYSE